MSKKSNIKSSDYHGIVELIVDTILGVTDLTGAVQKETIEPSFLASTPIQKLITSIASFTNDSVKQVTKLVGGGLHQVLDVITPMMEDGESSETREIILAILNGVVGDYLEKTNNSLGIQMHLKYQGEELVLNEEGINEQLAEANGKFLLVAHGLCMNDLQWTQEKHNHAEQLARDFDLTPIYLTYNSGKHISTNGKELDQLIEQFTSALSEPVEEMFILTHSMGGLVTRSAYHYSQERGGNWHKQINKIFFLGTPHHGAPLEQAGNYIDIFLESLPYAKPFAKLGKVRSAGIKDLRYGNVLDSDWENQDKSGSDKRTNIPLPTKTTCYAVAGTLEKYKEGALIESLRGDGLVYINSALGKHKDPSKSLAFAPERTCKVYECGHIELLSHPKVYAQLSLWMEE